MGVVWWISSLNWVLPWTPMTFPFYYLQLDTVLASWQCLQHLLHLVTFYSMLFALSFFPLFLQLPFLSTFALLFLHILKVSFCYSSKTNAPIVVHINGIKENSDLTPSLVFLNLIMSFSLSQMIMLMLASSIH